MDKIAGALVTNLSQPLVDLLVVVIGAAIAKAIQFLSAHVKVAQGVQAQAALDRLEQLADTVVRDVAQTTVDSLKARAVDGKLTDAAAAGAAHDAFEKMKAHLGGDAGLAALAKVVGTTDAPALVMSHIEAAVHKIAPAT